VVVNLDDRAIINAAAGPGRHGNKACKMSSDGVGMKECEERANLQGAGMLVSAVRHDKLVRVGDVPSDCPVFALWLPSAR
jgi:hypothetical protein